jgi:hypothetical protein
VRSISIKTPYVTLTGNNSSNLHATVDWPIENHVVANETATKLTASVLWTTLAEVRVLGQELKLGTNLCHPPHSGVWLILGTRSL